ncbi:TIM barrel protein [Arsenicibacter rosenii]|uniref:Xylose isomerase-like TIM barrel domain-containing protein n=1 Tax=Arsenicibacter rosenii TaxID=1750698 RepID=A0A1S2VAB3_9BACT|nr:TIM barrel protein [Arsenicibacter rosenii]OIN55622.1 hypothetical protein BLX24_29120 [Arsenicibacter rosenii]
MFECHAGKDPLDQLRFMAETGFRALEDSGPAHPGFPGKLGLGFMQQPVELVTKIGETLASLNMEMGTISLGPTFWPSRPSLTTGNPELRAVFLARCRMAMETLRRLNGRFVTVSADLIDFSLPTDIQTQHVMDALQAACDLLEPAGITLLLEPLSDATPLFLKTSAKGYQICKSINRPSCKLLFDMYHLQRNEGRLLYHMDLCWDQIGYFQIGDEPGRFEPTTGEINYKTIFRYIDQKSRETNRSFILGMEHFNSQPGIGGEQAVLAAYRYCDDF